MFTAFSQAHSFEITARFTPSSSVTRGRNVSLQCSWVGVFSANLTIAFNAGSSKSALKNLYKYSSYLQDVKSLSDHHRRLSENVTARTSSSMTMIISNVNCSDEGIYYCIVQNLLSVSNHSQALYIKGNDHFNLLSYFL